MRVGGEQGRANTVKDVERAIVTLSRAVQLVSEDPRAYGIRAAAHRKLSVFHLQTQDAAAISGRSWLARPPWRPLSRATRAS